MERLQDITKWMALLSQLGHVFCCGLPTFFGILSLLSSLGMVTVLPFGVHDFHHMMHDYESIILMTAAFLLAFGWILHFISNRLDCHTTGCTHPPCVPKKNHSTLLLQISTGLFVINSLVFIFAH